MSDDPELFERGNAVANVGLVGAAAVLVVPLGLKLWRARGMERADAVPGMAAAATVMVCGSAYMLARLGHFTPSTIEASSGT